MIEWRPRGCQWLGPEQDPLRDPQVHFCAAPVVQDKSYCANHYWKVFQKGTALAGSTQDREIQKLIDQQVEDLTDD